MIKPLAILGWLLLLLTGLTQCTPQYNNCEGYKLKPVSEIPARCIKY